MKNYHRYKVYIPTQFVWEFERRMRKMTEEYAQAILPNFIYWTHLEEEKDTENEGE